ncbi:MAG: methyltransferase domain-containing protein [Saprospiraceae bacterium]
MKFVYPQGPRFSNQELIEILSAAAQRLETKLNRLNLEALAISPYIRKYAKHHLTNLEHSLQMYTYLLYLALDQHPIDREKMVVVDYGGGTGILSFLAAELGFAKVIYNDIYEVCCHDAQVLAEALGYEITFVKGEVTDVIHYCETESLACQVVLSSEVIEHVYEIENLLKALPRLGKNTALRIVLETAANSLNPVINRRLKKAQQTVDQLDREMYPGKKEQDSLQAYATIRKQLLKAFTTNQLSEQEVEQLSKLTRGKIKKDIEAAAKSYLTTGILPQPIDHPTNTCDPLTGNWCEKLMNPYQLNEILARQGCTTKVLQGFYGSSPQSGKKNKIKALFNWIIGRLGTPGVRLAPYYVLLATKD